MPNFTIRWANRSRSNSTQDWMISNGDNFTLPPDWVRAANVVIHHNYTFRIAVDTDAPRHTTAELIYTAATNTWALFSLTPNQWQLAVGVVGDDNIVSVRCLLENENEEIITPSYEPFEAEPANDR